MNMICLFLVNEDLPEFIDFYYKLGTHDKTISVLKTSKDPKVISSAYSILRALVYFKPKYIVEVT